MKPCKAKEDSSDRSWAVGMDSGSIRRPLPVLHPLHCWSRGFFTKRRVREQYQQARAAISILRGRSWGVNQIYMHYPSPENNLSIRVHPEGTLASISKSFRETDASRRREGSVRRQRV
jgi:hypothetical protein